MDKCGKKWNVGGGLIHFEPLMRMLLDMNEFYNLDGSLVHSVYDSHAGLPWNGGRYMVPFPFSLQESVRRVAAYNRMGIGFSITFSNRFIDEKDLDHPDCNWFLEQCHRPGNGIIVATNLLRHYIRTTFPKYQVIASIGWCRKDEAFYLQAQKDYDIVVLHPDLNRAGPLLNRLDPAKLEVLVNEYCVADCPYRDEHSRYISQVIKAGTFYFRSDSEYASGTCPAVARGRVRDNSLVLSLAEIDALHRRGVTRFKIQGREHAFEAGIYRAVRDYVVCDGIRTLCGTTEGARG